MSQPIDQRILLRWIFLISGWFLLLCDNFVVQTVLGVDIWAAHLYPDQERRQALIVAIAHLGILVSSLLCLLTSRGLRRSRKWSRWSGVAACVSMLPGFPWLTIAGAVGLCVLIAKLPRLEAPPAPKQTTDYWTRKRKSWVQQVFIYVGFFVACGPGMVWVERYARRLSMPAWHPHGLAIPYLIVFGLWITAIHEMGHATVAWALYHRVRRINVGPFTFTNAGHGFQFHFEWKRLLNGGGHVAAIPPEGEHLRLKFMAMVAAGPAASLLNALLMFAVFLSLAGTRWQAYWWIPGFICVLSIFDGVLNLVPAGYSDGSMLFHLMLWTPHGQVLIQHLQAAQMHEDADECHNQADFEREVELRETALGRAQEGGEGSALAIAIGYQYLGHARLAMEDWTGAEAEHRRCLKSEAECALNPAMTANAWLGLQRACIERHHVDEAARVYANAAPVIERRQKNRDRIGLAVAKTMLAQVHQRGGAFDKALHEVSEVLRILPPGRDRLMLRAILHSIQAQCEFALDSVERGTEATRQLAEIVRSGKLPPAKRNLGWDELGELGEDLWKLGQESMALELMREATEQLEAGDAQATAAQYRIKLAAAHRQLGKLDEAGKWLPNEDELSVVSRRCLLAERARLHMPSGRAQEAVADARALLALWQVEPNDPVTEVAVAESLLAEACLAAEEYGQAETLARKALDVLSPWKHSESAACLVTLALARWHAYGAWMPRCMDEARILIEADPLLSPAAKKRVLETQAARLERYGPAKPAVAPSAFAAYR